MKRKLLAGFMAVCLILTLLPATALAADETITVSDTLSLATAIAQANAVGGEDPVTVVIPEGTYSPTANEQLVISRKNVTIQGAGMDATTIACGEYACSGQGAIIVAADGVTLKDLTVTSEAGGGVAAIKVTALEAVNSSMRLVEGVQLENVRASAEGHGLNLHGVKNAQVVNCKAGGGKCGISLANAVGVTISGTAASGKWGSIGMMYADTVFYENPVSLIVGRQDI